MDTQFTINEIELLIFNSGIFNKRQDIFVPNVSYGLLEHEADLVVMTKSGYLSEIEIKRSWADFLADFKKPHGHKDERVYRFYYAVPEKIAELVIEYIQDHQVPTDGVIVYYENGTYSFTPGGKMGVYYSHGRKLFMEEQLTIARLGCMRIWNLKQKIVESSKKL